MKNVGYYNGEIGALEDIKAPIMDRGFYFGDGCYDATMVRSGAIHNTQAHVDRTFNSARLLKIDLPFTKDELVAELMKVVEAFSGDAGLLYWQVTRGTAKRSHVFNHEMKANLMITCMETEITPKSSEINCISVEDKRFRYCNIKTLNLLPNCLVATKAAEVGCEEIIFVRDGYVTEMAHSNVSFIVGDTFVHHPFDDQILPGISLKNMIAACEKLGIKTEARALTFVEAMNADELIASSSSSFCTRIASVDGIPVGGKNLELLRRIQDAIYEEYEDLNN